MVNKLSAKLQSEGNEIERRKLWNYRRKRINQLFGVVSNFLISLCLKEGIGKIIVSDSLTEEYQKEGTRGKRFNQAFRHIPLGKLIQKFQYKCQLTGMELLIEPEPLPLKYHQLQEILKELQVKAGKI